MAVQGVDHQWSGCVVGSGIALAGPVEESRHVLGVDIQRFLELLDGLAHQLLAFGRAPLAAKLLCSSDNAAVLRALSVLPIVLSTFVAA